MSEQDPSSSESQDCRQRMIVVLTDRRPVEIVDGDWTEICRAEYLFSSVAVDVNAAANLIVRRHVGGQFLVYGIYSVGSYSNRDNRSCHKVNARHGEIVPDPGSSRTVGCSFHQEDNEWVSVVAAIKRVCMDLMAAVPEDRDGEDMPEVQSLGLKYISKLSAQDLTDQGQGLCPMGTKLPPQDLAKVIQEQDPSKRILDELFE